MRGGFFVSGRLGGARRRTRVGLLVVLGDRAIDGCRDFADARAPAFILRALGAFHQRPQLVPPATANSRHSYIAGIAYRDGTSKSRTRNSTTVRHAPMRTRSRAAKSQETGAGPPLRITGGQKRGR